MSKRYLVTWEIELDADDPRQAAADALRIQRDGESIATVFDVIEFGGDGVPMVVDIGVEA